MPRLKDKYQNEVLPKLQEEFGIKNKLATPRLEKIVINVGAGEAKDDSGIMDKIVENLTTITGQKPVVTKAKQSIAGFKLAKGHSVGAKVTLRGDRMYEFLDKLISLVLPKVRDFRGVSNDAFDSRGNYTLGMREQALFPEISFQAGAYARAKGLEMTIVSTSKSKEQGKKLLELLGVPFKKEQNG